MKAFTCEMCGSTDLLKQDGVFVCQQCGTKYSVEEARKMMVEGTVSVQGTVSVDNSNLLDNLIILGRRAIKNKSIEEAIDYYKRILEIDPFSKEANFVCDCFIIFRYDDGEKGWNYDKGTANKYINKLSNEEKTTYFEVLKDYYLDDCKRVNDEVFKAWGDLFVNFWVEHIDETLNYHYEFFISFNKSYYKDGAGMLGNMYEHNKSGAVDHYKNYCEHFTRLKELKPSLDLHKYQARVSEMEEKLKELDKDERKKKQKKGIKSTITGLLFLAVPVLFIFGIVGMCFEYIGIGFGMCLELLSALCFFLLLAIG